MSTEENQDETSSFVAVSTDVPQPVVESQEEPAAEEPASSEAPATDDKTLGDDKPEDTPAGTDAAAKTEKAEKQDRVQKRIDKVIKEREGEKRKNEALQRRVDELEAKKASPEKSESKEPVQENFESYDDYLDALDVYEQNVDAEESKPKGDESKAEVKDNSDEQPTDLSDSQKTAMAIIRETVEAAEKPDDFEDVALNPEVPITGDMLEALAECEDPAKVMYHLGQNKDLAADIAGKSQAAQMRAIANLDMTVDVKPAKPTKLTNAPDPIAPVKGSDSQQKHVNDMSFSEYEAHMNKLERGAS